MRIDSSQYEGRCDCGSFHHMQTKLCVIEGGALQRFEQYMEQTALFGKRCAVYDGNTYRAVAAELHPRAEQEILLASSGLHADEYSTAQVLAELESDVEVMIAVGGGPLHDIVRYCAKQRGIPFVSVPTAASCDGFSAEVAAMTWGGCKKTMSCQAPVLLVADIEVIRRAPIHLVRSGIGDVLGKFVALVEWQMAHLLTGEAFCQKIYNMMHEAAQRMWDSCESVTDGDEEALQSVTYALMLSGIAMQLFGNSRPASGAEHHISHLIEVRPQALGIEGGASHGEQVALGTLLTSREYYRLAEIEDIAPYLVPYAPVDDGWMREFFGPALYDGIRDENARDCLAAVTPEMIAAAWPAMRKIIAELPKEADIYAKLSRLGAKTSLEEIGIPEEKRAQILDTSPLVRNRLTLMRMRRMIRV